MKKAKTLFLTGGASGIGAATVTHFLHHGWNVGFVDRDAQKGAALIERLGNLSSVTFLPADVRDLKALEDAASYLHRTYGKIDALFCNAGIHRSANILETDPELWDEVININLKGTYLTLKALFPFLLKNRESAIVLMGSDQSLIGKKNSFAYGASKGAIGQITKSLALDYASQGLRVNCVCPATIDTPLARQALQSYADRFFGGDLAAVMQLEAQEFPMGRIGTPEEVAKVVYFLLTDASSYMTGTLIPIDGGYTAQ